MRSRFGTGNTVCTLGSVPVPPRCGGVSSRADSGLHPQADLGVASSVTEFPSSLSQLLLLLWQRGECLSGVGHAPRLVISAPFLSVVSVLITGRRGWECYWVSADLLPLSPRRHEQTLTCFKPRSKTCVWFLVILDAQDESTGSPSEQTTRSRCLMPGYGLWASGRPGFISCLCHFLALCFRKVINLFGL